MSPQEIKAALRRLQTRTSSNASRTEESGANIFAWSHRYALNPCISETEVTAFEAKYDVVLPSEYRTFLTEVGNGGAGPCYGLFPLGTYNDQALEPDILDSLSQPFDEDAAEEWEGDGDPLDWEEVMQGALILSTEGCARWFWLVVSGPNAGEIWFDARADGEAPDCVVGDTGPLGFWEWYEEWLLPQLGAPSDGDLRPSLT